MVQSQVHKLAVEGSNQDDPYLQVLMGRASDYLSNDNIVHSQSCLLLTTFIMCILSLQIFTRDDTKSLYEFMIFRLIMTALYYILWLIIICRGT